MRGRKILIHNSSPCLVTSTSPYGDSLHNNSLIDGFEMFLTLPISGSFRLLNHHHSLHQLFYLETNTSSFLGDFNYLKRFLFLAHLAIYKFYSTLYIILVPLLYSTVANNTPINKSSFSKVARFIFRNSCALVPQYFLYHTLLECYFRCCQYIIYY
jgi:hypothetical protein